MNTADLPKILTNAFYENHPRLARLIFHPEQHQYVEQLEQIPSVTEVLKDVGVTDFSKVPLEVLEFARIRGTAVHYACHYLDMGVLRFESLDPNIVPYVESYLAFKQAMGPAYNPGLIELPVFDPTWRYAGTPDRLPYIHAERCVLDLKTNRESAKATRMQTAAYKLAHQNLFPELPPPVRRFELKLLASGKMAELIEFTDHEGDEADFLACLTVYRLKRS